MDTQATPEVSVIMPVFNAGDYLSEAINSVLNQQAIDGCAPPSFELILVDDHSIDKRTLELLASAPTLDNRVRVLRNERKKGAAGARNTGIIHARGKWIAFLDADDLWFTDSLAFRWRHLSQIPEARWSGARFRLFKPTAFLNGTPVFSLTDHQVCVEATRIEPSAMVRLSRPVTEFGASCMIGIMTVLIQRSLIQEKGMFNEQLTRAEDYHLWFQCAFDNDLWMIEANTALYRIHQDSLTHGNHPKFLYEDTMIKLLLKDPAGRQHRPTLIRRFDYVMQDQCYFYRSQKLFAAAFDTVVQWLASRPLNISAWKELLACSLRVS